MERPSESVWDYPRPPRLETDGREIRVVHRGQMVATSTRAQRVLETSHPPVFYLPPQDVRTDLLIPGSGISVCEWKGLARYWDLVVGDDSVENAAWSYPDPKPKYSTLAGWIAFYPGRVDTCTVDGETVVPQAGDFYGGWITSEITGPFKGGAGTAGW